MNDEQRIYCRFCGAKLKKDSVGLYCPTDNCQWQYGLPEDEPGALTPKAKRDFDKETP